MARRLFVRRGARDRFPRRGGAWSMPSTVLASSPWSGLRSARSTHQEAAMPLGSLAEVDLSEGLVAQHLRSRSVSWSTGSPRTDAVDLARLSPFRLRWFWTAADLSSRCSRSGMPRRAMPGPWARLWSSGERQRDGQGRRRGRSFDGQAYVTGVSSWTIPSRTPRSTPTTPEPAGGSPATTRSSSTARGNTSTATLTRTAWSHTGRC